MASEGFANDATANDATTGIVSAMAAPATTSVRADGGKPRKAKKGHVRHVQLLIVLVFVGAMYYSFQSNVLSKSTAVPMQIGQLVRYQFETDQQAIPQLRQLYATEMPITTAYVAHYESEGANLNIWVGEAAADDVMRLLDDLTNKIESGENGTYTDLKKLDVSGMTVYAVKRDKEPQFYYQSGKKFVWIGIKGDTGSANQLLVDAMRAVTGSHDGM
ncbi:MAG: hypothetical protein M1343_00825 [Chloroflexi bacterium]|nr:hypothetical protein [Chloroflexota bacterium]